MQVKFTDKYIILRISASMVVDIIFHMAASGATEEVTIIYLGSQGWDEKELKKFDEDWSKLVDNSEIYEKLGTDMSLEEVIDMAKEFFKNKNYKYMK